MLTLNAGGRGLVFLQLNVPDLLTSHGSPYPLGGMDEVGVGWGRAEGRHGGNVK